MSDRWTRANWPKAHLARGALCGLTMQLADRRPVAAQVTSYTAIAIHVAAGWSVHLCDQRRECSRFDSTSLSLAVVTCRQATLACDVLPGQACKTSRVKSQLNRSKS